MQIAVLGATGPTGLEIVKQGLAGGDEVVALVRSPDKFPSEVTSNPKFKAIKLDVLNAEALAEGMKGCQAVLSALGTLPKPPGGQITFYSESMKAIAEAMRKAGIKRLVVCSSWYTSPKPDEPRNVKWFLRPVLLGRNFDDMNRMEEFLVKECQDISFTVVRPPHLTNDPLSGKAIKTDEYTWVRGEQGSISRADVAKFMLETSRNEEAAQKLLAIIV